MNSPLLRLAASLAGLLAHVSHPALPPSGRVASLPPVSMAAARAEDPSAAGPPRRSLLPAARVGPAPGGLTLVVTSTGDESDQSPGDGRCATATGSCTLRAALEEANAHPGADEIHFAIAQGTRLAPASPLPVIRESLVLDATTQPGYAGEPLIYLDGALIPPDEATGRPADGLVIAADNSTLRGLAIRHFGGNGVLIAGGAGNRIHSCLVEANGSDGVAIHNGAHQSEIKGNLIRNNGGDGIQVAGPTTVDTLIRGNRVTGNSGFGVLVTDGARRTAIGGAEPGGANVIGANTGGGIRLAGPPTVEPPLPRPDYFAGGCLSCHNGNQSAWNYVGVDADIAPLPNGADEDPRPGVLASGTGNFIGPGNTIAWNTGPGVTISTGAGNAVRDNAIFDNGGLGIDLGGDGVTPNSSGSAVNNGQGFPVWEGPVGRADRLAATLMGQPNTRYRWELFANQRCDPSGHGEGARLLRIGRVDTDAAGIVRFETDLTALGFMPGLKVTATATGPGGNTSEFSRCIPVVTPQLYLPLADNRGKQPPVRAAKHPLQAPDNLVVARESFDPQPSWSWRGSHQIVFDPQVASNVLRLTASGAVARAIGGPVGLPQPGTYTLRWRSRTASVSQPVAVALEVGPRRLTDFEHLIQAGSTTWLSHTISFVALEGETEMRVAFSLRGEGELRLDDFELVLDPLAFQPRLPRAGLRRLMGGGFEGTLLVTPLVKVPPQAPLPPGLPTTDEIVLSAAQNEVEQVQLVVHPTSAFRRVEVSFSDLVGPALIPASRLSWRLVDAVEVAATDLRSPYGQAGQVPDPLLPATDFELPAGQNSTLLLQVQVPPTAVPGTYRSRLELAAAGAPLLEAPIRLTVWGFQLPDEPSLTSSSHFAPRRGTISRDDIVANILAHRQDAGRVIAIALEEEDWLRLSGDGVQIDFDTFDAIVEKWLARGVRRFSLPPINLRRRSPQGNHMVRWLGLEPLTPEFNAAFSDYLRQLEPHLAEKGWLKRAFLYLWDEPTPEEVPQFKALLQLARDAAPNLDTAVAGARLPNPELYGLIDIWMPNLRRQILQEDDWARIAERQAAGEIVGAYGNNRYALDLPLQFVRLWPWTLRRYGLTYTGWYSINGWEEDPWHPTYRRRLGAGYFLYPPPDPADPPLDSLRWEALRAGMEDYEYLALIAERTDAVRQTLAAEGLFAGDQLVQHFTAPLVWGTTERDFTAAADLLAEIREAMAREIEASARPPLLLAAFIPQSADQAIVHVRTEPGTAVWVNGERIEAHRGHYQGAVRRMPGQTAVAITARLDHYAKTVWRFWPQREPASPIYLPACHR